MAAAKITLSDAEQAIGKWLAKKRFELARANEIPNERIGPQSDWETDLQGIGAEFVVCKVFNVYPDLDIGHRPLEDGVTQFGVRFDAKATAYANGHLAVRIKKSSIPCDLYVLCVGTFPIYRIAGVMTAEELFQPHRIGNLGHGPGYLAKQQELLPIDGYTQ